jgi:ABC-type sugar transport system ATPase subunit
VLDQLGLRHVHLGTPVETLSIGERQLVEIARLLVRDARLLILDEPTATLSKPEIERVFRATRDLVAQGRSVIFVSHRLDEVFELCDRVTVLRDGRRVGTHEIHEIDRRALIELMLGEMEGAKAMEEHEHTRPGSGEPLVEIRRLTVPGDVEDVSLVLESGLITGLAGQVGSGTSTILRALGGLVPGVSGTVEVRGRPVLLNTPRRAVEAGVLYIPNDRQREGLFLGQTVERNLTVARLGRLSRLGVLLRRRAHRAARALAEMAGVPVERLGSPAGSLSGGN